MVGAALMDIIVGGLLVVDILTWLSAVESLSPFMLQKFRGLRNDAPKQK